MNFDFHGGIKMVKKIKVWVELSGGDIVNDDIYSFMKCSNCKDQILIKDVEGYCPNCGVKLEGVGD